MKNQSIKVDPSPPINMLLAMRNVTRKTLPIKKWAPHCNDNPIYVFLFWELRGLSPNFHNHVSVSDSYIPRIGPHFWLQQNRQTNPGNI